MHGSLSNTWPNNLTGFLVNILFWISNLILKVQLLLGLWMALNGKAIKWKPITKCTSNILQHESHQYEIASEDLKFHLVYCKKLNNYTRNKRMEIWDDIELNIWFCWIWFQHASILFHLGLHKQQQTIKHQSSSIFDHATNKQQVIKHQSSSIWDPTSNNKNINPLAYGTSQVATSNQAWILIHLGPDT